MIKKHELVKLKEFLERSFQDLPCETAIALINDSLRLRDLLEEIAQLALHPTLAETVEEQASLGLMPNRGIARRTQGAPPQRTAYPQQRTNSAPPQRPAGGSPPGNLPPGMRPQPPKARISPQVESLLEQVQEEMAQHSVPEDDRMLEALANLGAALEEGDNRQTL